MIEIDGTAGGGQVLRSALSCSLLTGRPVSVRNVRAARPNPGVRPQHAAAIRLAASVGDAAVARGDVGDDEVRFEPRELRGGPVSARVGTAGSTNLLVDVLLPLGPVLDEPLVATLRGGTDVEWAPPAAYLLSHKLPLLRRLGVLAAVDVDRRGFYPAGGGQIRLSIAPSEFEPLELSPTSDPVARVVSAASVHLDAADVAGRQAAAATEPLASAGIEVVERTVSIVAADGPGSTVLVRLDGRVGASGTADVAGGEGERRRSDDGGRRPVGGFSALGERGVPAEEVGARAATAALSFPAERAGVDAHLADQLLVALAVAGGELWIPSVTDHVETNAGVIRAFGLDLSVEPLGGDPAADGAIVRAPGWDR